MRLVGTSGRSVRVLGAIGRAYRRDAARREGPADRLCAVERIGVIGAGPAGLAAVRELTAAGLDAVAFERGARVGGVWTLEDRPTAAYRSLHLITSRERTEFAAFPLPPGTADYPSRDAVGRYLESYVEHFGLADRLRPGSGVARAERDPAGGWTLTLDDGGTEEVDRLVVANGHNAVPKWPEPAYPGADAFAGEQLHAVDYDDARAFEGRRVLVVGMGNSAMDIASDLSLVADHVVLSVRHGSWVVPKRLLGKPADQVTSPWAAVHVPLALRQAVSQTLLRLVSGPPERYGLPKPQRGLFEDHPTISDTILSRISHGRITPRGAISRLEADGVVFADGVREQLDAIVWCTGYRVDMPFLDPALLGPEPTELPLYKRVFHLDVPDLHFVGYMQSTGSAFPIVERQSALLAAALTGRWAPPSRAEMAADCARRRADAVRRWGDRGRPAMRVDFDRYMHELAAELEAGAARVATVAA
ncbi:NAD(P)-binding protein [Conexibacter sp. W3-3-2]|nr:NAD(P)-binding protein [Conexibacter sp. W3-3-2]